jgi:hypothetical protein
MARNNQLWGAERIRGEWLKASVFASACRTIQKYMRPVRKRRATGKNVDHLLTHAGSRRSGPATRLPVTALFLRSFAGFLHHRIAHLAE